jgi:DNA (cytosine-5)-methyltransferase 1
VFVVGYLGDWRPPAAVLFERESLCGHPPPSREAGQVAPTIPSRSAAGGGLGTDFDCDGGLVATLNCHSGGPRLDDPLIAFSSKDDGQGSAEDLAPTVRSGNKIGSARIAVAYDVYNGRLTGETMGTLREMHGTNTNAVLTTTSVRRLTPRECERLQGFPDDWTLVPYRKKPAADGPRYRALGNSMAVPVMRWIGGRIRMVEGLWLT